jgi:hypothetical protein
MGSGVAGQCSENRCLARWTVWTPHRGRRGGTGRAKTWSRVPIRGFCALQAVAADDDREVAVVQDRSDRIPNVSLKGLTDEVSLGRSGRPRNPGSP